MLGSAIMQRLRSYLYDELNSITPAEIARTLKARFQIEQFAQYFSLRAYHFKGSVVQITVDDNLLLEFPTPKKDHPEFYSSEQYRLLLVLSASTISLYTPPILQDLDHIVQGENIDQIVVWTRLPLDRSTTEVLKNHRTTLIHIAQSEFSEAEQISAFLLDAAIDSSRLIALNFVTDLLIKRLKKLFHFVLSEIAAPIYDFKYGKAKVATKRLMEREQVALAEVVEAIHKNTDPQVGIVHPTRIAVDVGCGTGRHSFALAKMFSKVYAFDFSGRMIEKARERKRAEDNRNIVFAASDLEYEQIDGEQDFSGQVDLVWPALVWRVSSKTLREC